jgi:tetratricopeptide (TPR) repeat protein
MHHIVLTLAIALALLATCFGVLAEFIARRAPMRPQLRKVLPCTVGLLVCLGLLQLVMRRNDPFERMVQYGCVIGLAVLAVLCLFGTVRLLALLPRLPSHRTVVRVERLVREERLPELEQELRREIEQEGLTAERLGVLGGCLSRQDKWDEALEVFRQLNERDDTAGIYLSLEGFALWKLGHAEEALAHLEEAVRKHPKEPLGFMRYAQVLAGLGRLDEAEQALARAEQLFAPYRDSRGAWRLGWVKLFAESRDKVERARILAQSAKADL